MFSFILDKSNYFDFMTKNQKDLIIDQNSQLPFLEIFPIKTENFPKLLKYIQNSEVTFSMYDNYGFYKIINKGCVINLIMNDKPDSCNSILDFSIRYYFNKNDVNKKGVYNGEFKILFKNNLEEKTLITPINNKILIHII